MSARGAPRNVGEKRREPDEGHRPPARGMGEGAAGHRRRNLRQHAVFHGRARHFHAGPGRLDQGTRDRRTRSDAAVHAAPAGYLRRRRIRGSRKAVAPARALSHPARRHRRGRRARRHAQRHFRRNDADLFHGPRRRRRRDRRLHPRLSPLQIARSRPLDSRRDAELPYPGRLDAFRGQRADRLWRRDGHPGRHHRRGRRRRDAWFPWRWRRR